MEKCTLYEKVIPLQDGTYLEVYRTETRSGNINENYTHFTQSGRALAFFEQTHLGKTPELSALLTNEVTPNRTKLNDLFLV